MSLNTEQINALLAPINPARVKETQGNSNIEAWDVRRWLLRIFGWGGWDFTVKDCTLVSEISELRRKKDKKGEEYGDPYLAHTVIYRVVGQLSIRDTAGKVLAVFEDGATGDAINQPSLGDAHDFALKTAMSQALKRCAVNLGDQFGLSLYNKGSRTAVVGKSAAHSDTEEHAADEQVRGGELDTAPVAEPDPPAAEQAPEPPAPGAEESVAPDVPDDSATSPDAAVEALRARVIDAMSLPKKDALQVLARIGIDVSAARLKNAMTVSPAGVEMSLGAMVDQALQFVSAPKPHGIHDDEADRQEAIA